MSDAFDPEKWLRALTDWRYWQLAGLLVPFAAAAVSSRSMLESLGIVDTWQRWGAFGAIACVSLMVTRSVSEASQKLVSWFFDPHRRLLRPQAVAEDLSEAELAMLTAFMVTDTERQALDSDATPVRSLQRRGIIRPVFTSFELTPRGVQLAHLPWLMDHLASEHSEMVTVIKRKFGIYG